MQRLNEILYCCRSNNNNDAIRSLVESTSDPFATELCCVAHEHRYALVYRQSYNISRIIPQNLKVSSPVLQLSMFNPLKPVVKSRWKM